MASDDLRARIAEALEAADYRAPMQRGDLADAVLPVIETLLARRDKRIEEYRESRRRWMEAAFADRRAANGVAEELNRALAALQAVRESRSLGEALAAVAKHDGLTTPALAPQMTAEDVRGGFWPDMTGGRCSPCHLAALRGYEPEPDCPDCQPTTKE